jgi:WD40 repeat protein
MPLQYSRKFILSSEHRAKVHAVAFSPDGRFLATSGSDIINIWSTLSGAVAFKIATGNVNASSLTWTSDQALICGMFNGYILTVSIDEAAKVCWTNHLHYKFI